MRRGDRPLGLSPILKSPYHNAGSHTMVYVPRRGAAGPSAPRACRMPPSQGPGLLDDLPLHVDRRCLLQHHAHLAVFLVRQVNRPFHVGIAHVRA